MARLPLALLPIGLAAVVHFQITGNYFYQDDFLSLHRIVNRSALEYLLTPHGGHILFARNAVFWLFYQLFGTASAWYFAVVLLTHLLNVYLLFAVVRAQTGNAPIACFGAALWGISRVNEGALGWYSVYGQVLVGTCLLWFLNRLSRIAAGAPLPRYAWARWVLLLAVAATSFGVGLAVALVSPLVAWLLLPASRERTVTVRVLCGVALATPLLYVGMQWLYVTLYEGRSDVPRIIGALDSPGLIATFTADLALAGVTRLCLGVFSGMVTFPNPTSLLVGGLVLAALLLVAARAPATVRARLAAYVIVALACYGSIAVARAPMLRNRIAMAVGEARYHYVALLPVTALLCELLRAGTGVLGAAQAPILILATLATPLLSYDPDRSPLYDPNPARRETHRILEQIHALAAQPGSGPVCLPNGAFDGIAGYIVQNPRMEFPGWAALYAIFEPDDTINGRRIYFVERNRAVAQAAMRGRRTAGLIVPPDRTAALGCRDTS